MPCPGTICRIDYERSTGWAILRHRGIHNHDWPTSKKCHPEGLAELEADIIANPTKKPLLHKVGDVLAILLFKFPSDSKR